jgi:hypothetical protein
MNKNDDFDFGFSIVDQEDLMQLQVVSEAVEEHKAKLARMRDMIMPLLTNLIGDTSKDYIYWPNRKDKIESFIKKLNAFVESA